MTQLHLLGIGDAHDGGRVKTAANFFAGGQRLVWAIGKQIRLVVLHSRTASELQVFFELANDARLFSAIAFCLRGGRRHHTRPFVIGFNQTLGLSQALK